MPSIARGGQGLFTRAHSFDFRSTGGKAGRMFRGSPVLLVTTGRKTGKPRSTPLMHLWEVEDMVVVLRPAGEDRASASGLPSVAGSRVEGHELAGCERGLPAGHHVVDVKFRRMTVRTQDRNQAEVGFSQARSPGCF